MFALHTLHTLTSTSDTKVKTRRTLIATPAIVETPLNSLLISSTMPDAYPDWATPLSRGSSAFSVGVPCLSTCNTSYTVTVGTVNNHSTTFSFIEQLHSPFRRYRAANQPDITYSMRRQENIVVKSNVLLGLSAKLVLLEIMCEGA